LVWVDVPGLKVSKPYIRTITTTESFLNLNYQIDSVHIYPDSLLITSTVDQVPLTTEIRLMPNPFNNEINVEFTLENSSDVGFEIYNLLGKQIAVIGKKRADTGYQHWTINSATYNLPEGVYLLKITVAGKVFSKRIIKMK
ncbi:MAG TPA: T9SS type A sorting domain-containing protein, partial [Nitrosopumilaceae archaeon]|nr:T9SS type A sorting domain-containing protein [Nitrosopumilaceae archaeon]